ncbi:MAG TPA: hypothetical protein DDW76_20395 [Cyanobacteria bacterium UBA11369]|nr:hypothetical protein [Cyanobacteria bacterium UBA11371]HBE36605.1 hypothetical protein [Cyanobacteria bacterium UBA11368]HBE51071.1 hypothetical protein [Cyanobacteria bacterium UBA11369]
MNAAFVRVLRSAYRKEPISSFILIVGAVDAVIGGVGDRGSLLAFGIGTVGLAIALRWLIMGRHTDETPAEAPQYYLPPQPNRPPLPTLNASNKKNRPY